MDVEIETNPAGRSGGTVDLMEHRHDRDTQFQAFFAAESAGLARFGAWVTGDVERGADLAQEALVRTYRHWGRVRNEDPGPYARRILVNLVRTQHRRRLLERRHEQTLRDEGVASQSGRVDDWMALSQALRKLSPIRRATVVLRYYEDMTEQQIADTLDRPLGTVKADLHRALAKLRPLLEEPTGESA